MLISPSMGDDHSTHPARSRRQRAKHGVQSIKRFAGTVRTDRWLFAGSFPGQAPAPIVLIVFSLQRPDQHRIGFCLLAFSRRPTVTQASLKYPCLAKHFGCALGTMDRSARSMSFSLLNLATRDALLGHAKAAAGPGKLKIGSPRGSPNFQLARCAVAPA
jgi:hypothetical protein